MHDFFITACIMCCFLKPAPSPECKIKTHIAIKGFLRPCAHFGEDSSVQTLWKGDVKFLNTPF